MIRMAKITRAMVVQNLTMQIGNVTQTVGIDEYPDSLRHSCYQTGVIFLPRYEIPVDTGEGYTIPFYYYYCGCCGKLFVQKHLYE